MNIRRVTRGTDIKNVEGAGGVKARADQNAPGDASRRGFILEVGV